MFCSAFKRFHVCVFSCSLIVICGRVNPTQTAVPLSSPQLFMYGYFKKPNLDRRIAISATNIVCTVAEAACCLLIPIFSFFFRNSESESRQSCPTLSDPRGCSPPGSSVPGILRARPLQWVAVLFSRGSSQPRDRTQVSRMAGRFFTI